MSRQSQYEIAMTKWEAALEAAQARDFGRAVQCVSEAYPIFQSINHPLVFDAHQNWVKWYALFQQVKETIPPTAAQNIFSKDKAVVEAHFEEKASSTETEAPSPLAILHALSERIEDRRRDRFRA